MTATLTALPRMLALPLLVLAFWPLSGAASNQCGDVNGDGFTNVVDALMIARGEIPPCAVCGNGVIEPGEECDEGDLGVATCETFGLPFGRLGCGLGCVHDLSGCRAERFEDNGDGTITDWQTGLMWEKKDDSGGVRDVDNFYTWTDASDLDLTDPDGTAFGDFLGALNNCVDDGTFPPTGVTGGFAGHCDWRLPTIVELQTILLEPDPCGTTPCIDPVFGPTASALYWSSTKLAVSPFFAWSVSFFDGLVFNGGKPGGFFVRGVRGGP